MAEGKLEVQMRSYDFSLRIYKVCKFFEEDKTARLITNQLLRSGTAISANIEEAVAAQSKKDFITKLSIALKEARETDYWLRLLRDTQVIPIEKISNIIDESEQLTKIIAQIIITTKKNLNV